MASAFSDSLMASGGWKRSLRSQETTKGTTLKCLPDIGKHKWAQNQNKNLHILSGL